MLNDNMNEQTEIMTGEMKNRLGDLICVAPWTELDLFCEFVTTQERKCF